MPSILPNQINYFKELQNEIETVKLNTKKRSQEHPDFSFHLSKDFEDLKTKLEDTNKLIAVTTIEGAHSLGNYTISTLKKDNLTEIEEKNLLESFTENITNLKNEVQKVARAAPSTPSPKSCIPIKFLGIKGESIIGKS